MDACEAGGVTVPPLSDGESGLGSLRSGEGEGPREGERETDVKE